MIYNLLGDFMVAYGVVVLIVCVALYLTVSRNQLFSLANSVTLNCNKALSVIKTTYTARSTSFSAKWQALKDALFPKK